MNQIERDRVNRKLDTDEKIVIKALTEKVASLKFEIKRLKREMTLQEILERIKNVLNQGVDTESQDLDLLKHDLENFIIEKENE